MSGDRTGSHYYNVMENAAVAAATTLDDAIDYNFTSGRLNPGFSNEIHALMGNLFLKYRGLEFFGTAEHVNGRTAAEISNRKATQYAGDVVYRFPADKENFWVGFRYNTVNMALAGTGDIKANREAGSFGWFLTKNVMMKAEYMNQKYMDYPATNILNGGRFNGVMLEASIGF